MTFTRIVGAFLMTAALVPATADAGDAAAGKALFAVCVACHGETGEGNQALNAPAIGGQEAWYVQRQLANFKGGVRGGDAGADAYGAQMVPMAAMLADDAAIANVAAYTASLSPAAPAASAGGDAATGAALYAVCAACHGADGKGIESMNAPSLSAQHDWYLARQLTNFKAGARGTHASDAYGMTMKPMADMLADDAAIKNVVAYVITLK